MSFRKKQRENNEYRARYNFQANNDLGMIRDAHSACDELFFWSETKVQFIEDELRSVKVASVLLMNF